MTRLLKTFFIFLFILFLLGPYLQKRRHFLRDFALTENRSKIPRPRELRLLFQNGGIYAHKYEEYYNDNYGLRDLFIRLKNQLDFWVFHQSDKVIVGREGWLFYKSAVEEELLYVEKTPSQAFNTMYSRLEKLNQHLRDRGITLVLLPCPMNNTIYPEMLPSNTARRFHPTGFERYQAFLKQHPELLSLDPYDLLVKLKGSFNVYHKTDFHWTDPAGAHVARELVNLLAQKSGLGPLWDRPIRSQRKFFTEGGENQALGLLWPIREPYLLLDDAGRPDQVGEYHYTTEANEWTYQTRLADHSKLIPLTVMFGDSFADAFERAGFTGYFSSFQKYYNYQFKEKFGQIPPGARFLVFEHVEPFLNAFLGDVIWPEEILR